MGVSEPRYSAHHAYSDGPSPSPSRPPSGTMTGRDLLSDPWPRERERERMGKVAVNVEEKEGRSEASRRGEKGEGNRELTSLIHLLVAFPVYILPPAGEYVGL